MAACSYVPTLILITRTNMQLTTLVTMTSHVASSFLLLAAEARRRRVRRRHYLTRVSLPLHLCSAWRAVLISADQRGLLNTTGFDRTTFNHLLSLFSPLWCQHRQRTRQICAADALGLCLQYLNSTARAKTLCQVFSLPPATLSRHLRKSLRLLLLAVSTDHDSRVCWPSQADMQQYCQLITAYEPGLTNIFGFVDGVYFRCNDPPDHDTQNAYYNGWKSCCSLTNVLVFAPDGCIIWACYNYPGSWHDAHLARPLYERLLDPSRTPPNLALVADTAFPRSGALQTKIITPPKVAEQEQVDAAVLQSGHASSPEAIVRARQAVEWGMHSLQSVFARLGIPLPYDPPYTQSLLKLVLHLFNLRVRRLQLNQIRSVYYGPLMQ
jgi:hypothetical protein